MRAKRLRPNGQAPLSEIYDGGQDFLLAAVELVKLCHMVCSINMTI